MEMENVVHSTEVLQVLDHSPVIETIKTEEDGKPENPEKSILNTRENEQGTLITRGQSHVAMLRESISAPAFDIPGSSLDLRFDIGFNEKLEYSKNLTPTNQSKKELYIKLDEILISSLHESFEVYRGASVDRVEMVEFLSSVVKRNIAAFPDLEKIMCLRDTVLTARVKRAFPEVIYKRKQIRQDHFRKAWLYVNIRRKARTQDDTKAINESTIKTEAHQRTTANSQSVITTGIWTPEVPKTQQPTENPKRRQTPLNTQLPPSHSPPLVVAIPFNAKEDHRPTTRSSQSRDKSDNTSSSSKSPSSITSGPVAMVTGYSTREKSAVVLDNYTITKWVKSNYVEDNTSYVPVQDVVKAFKISYGIDITYKECHQMIYSAFTSPRQRTCPLKTVRVSSMGAQYVYRGIAPIAAEKNDHFDEDSDAEDSSPEPLPHNDPVQEEREEVWRKLVEEIKQERDQAVTDRNQALSALMDLEKEHAHALTAIDQLRKELQVTTRNVNGRTGIESCTGGSRNNYSRLSPSNFEKFSETSASKAESNILSALAPTCEKCSSGKQAYEHLKEERDQIWRDIVKKATLEKEEAKKRLEVVKGERDAYLERLHNFEKENQQLRDSVPCSSPTNTIPKNNMSTIQAIKIERRSDALRTNIIKSNKSTVNKNSKDSLNSVLLHLRSKRKQSTPTKFSKVPRLSNSENDSQVESSVSPTQMDSGIRSPDDVFSGLDHSQAPEVMTSNCLNDSEGELCKSPSSTDPTEMLLFFEGSDMVAFKPHPMED